MRRAVVFGLLHAGLAVSRSLGRGGVPVTGIAWNPRDFGLRSRYLERRVVVPPADGEAVVAALRKEAEGGRVVAEAAAVSPGRELAIELRDGRIAATVTGRSA